MLKPVCFVSMALLVYLVTGCNDEKPVQQQLDNAFRFRVEVVDSTSGDGIAGLVVGACHHLNGPILMNGSILTSSGLARPAFSTSFYFSLKTSCRASLYFLNLRNELIDSIVLGEKSAGFYKIEWTEQVERQVPSGVYKCRLLATDVQVTDSVLYRDSILATIWRPDVLDHPLGTTDQKGIYETRDSLLFPGVLNLPEMTLVDEVCDTIGSFGFSDTVSIGLTDTSSGKHMVVEQIVRNRPDNIFRVVWKPQSVATRVPTHVIAPVDSDVIDTKGALLPEWGLSQNCPNPFN